MSQLTKLKKDLARLGSREKAKVYQWFFKTGPGEYGEGDIFLGVVVPDQRKVARKYKDLGLADIQKLLSSKVHEHRLTGLFILVGQYERYEKAKNIYARHAEFSSASNKKSLKQAQDDMSRIYKFYLKNAKRINNWDLVDASAPNIVGNYLLISRNGAKLYAKKREILYNLVRSKNLWERRIAILATFAFIRGNDYKDTLKISEILLKDDHDLIHKAVGWMLREVGKRDQKVLERFLYKHVPVMPRIMLRYAIEKFPEKKRKFYMR